MSLRPIAPRQQHVLAAVLVALISACGDDSPATLAPLVDASLHADASTRLDAAVSIDAAAPATAPDAASPVDAAAAPIPTYNGCSAADYLDKSRSNDSRTIQIAQLGFTYTPKCIIIAKGQTVTWTGELSVHPLAPGNALHNDAGTTPSPIATTASGNVVSFTFPAAGTYPYYCQVHGTGDGEGMSGSIHVE